MDYKKDIQKFTKRKSRIFLDVELTMIEKIIEFFSSYMNLINDFKYNRDYLFSNVDDFIKFIYFIKIKNQYYYYLSVKLSEIMQKKEWKYKCESVVIDDSFKYNFADKISDAIYFDIDFYKICSNEIKIDLKFEKDIFIVKSYNLMFDEREFYNITNHKVKIINMTEILSDIEDKMEILINKI